MKAGTPQGLSVRAKTDGNDCGGVSFQRFETVAGAHLPQTDRLVSTAAGQQGAIRAELDRADLACMGFQDFEAEAGADLPQADRLVLTAAGQQSSIRAE